MKTSIAVFLLAVSVSSAIAADFSGSCGIRFDGISTLHDFSGTARCQPFKATLASGPEGKSVVTEVEIAVIAGEMDTKDEKRDKEMRKMFEVEKYPRIQARLTDVEPDRIRREIGKDPNGKGAVELTLKIRNVERRVRAVIGNLRETRELVTFDAQFPVSLREFGLKPPSVLFGMISVRDTITVTAAFSLEAVPPK